MLLYCKESERNDIPAQNLRTLFWQALFIYKSELTSHLPKFINNAVLIVQSYD